MSKRILFSCFRDNASLKPKLLVFITRFPNVRRQSFSSKPNRQHGSHGSSFPKTRTSTSESTISGILTWYSEKLDAYPILTKCISSGVVSGFADFLCQALVKNRNHDGREKSDQESKQSWDIPRTGRFAVLGTFWVGPVLHFWYGSLSGVGGKAAWLKRVLLDQFVFAPVFLTSFLSWLWCLEGEDATTIQQRLQQEVPGVVVSNWCLWIPAQFVNLNFVPVKYQVLFSNFVALMWNAYLSFSTHEKLKDP